MSRTTRAGEGRPLTLPDATVTLLEGGGDYEVFLVEAGRGDPPPVHSEAWSKTYYVLDGRIRVRCEDSDVELGPGDSIAFTAGTMNSFAVCTPTARFLLISAGDRMSRFFDAVTRSAVADLPDVAMRYGIALDGTGAS